MKCVVSFSFSSCLIASAVLFAQVSINLHPPPSHSHRRLLSFSSLWRNEEVVGAHRPALERETSERTAAPVARRRRRRRLPTTSPNHRLSLSSTSFLRPNCLSLLVLLIILTSSRSDEGGGLRQRHSTPGMEAQYSLSLRAPGKTSSYAQSVHMSFRMQSMIRNPLRRGNFDPPPFFTLSRHPFHCGGARRLADCKKCGIVA